MEVSGKFLYNLVTKRRFYLKPMISDLKSAIKSLHLHAVCNNVNEISVPRLGAGLDCLRLEDREYVLEGYKKN